MSESSSENQGRDHESEESMVDSHDRGSEQKVPVSALAKERAEKRAARNEAEVAKQELQALKEQIPGLDVDRLAAWMAEVTQDAARKTAEAETAPLRKEVERYRKAISLGLNEAQLDALARLKDETPGLSDERALSLLRLEQPDLFPRQESKPSSGVMRGLPVGGNSPVGQDAPKEDLVAKIAEANAAKDWKTADKLAAVEFRRRILSHMPHLNPNPSDT